MPDLDPRIDDLYRQPLGAFVSARNALAKTVAGGDAARVRGLAKPTVVPWAANQVYWHARPIYDRVLASGKQLRAAQIANLEGKRADVRGAMDAHRRALTDAVQEAERLAAAEGAKPDPDALMRTFEALSLASAPAEPHGRLTKPLRPSGFEALAGVKVQERPPGQARLPETAAPRPAPRTGGHRQASGGSAQPEAEPPTSRRDRRSDAAREKEARARAEAERQRDTARKQAQAALTRAEAAEQLARANWECAHDRLLEARRHRAAIKSEL